MFFPILIKFENKYNVIHTQAEGDHMHFPNDTHRLFYTAPKFKTNKISLNKSIWNLVKFCVCITFEKFTRVK